MPNPPVALMRVRFAGPPAAFSSVGPSERILCGPGRHEGDWQWSRQGPDHPSPLQRSQTGPEDPCHHASYRASPQTAPRQLWRPRLSSCFWQADSDAPKRQPLTSAQIRAARALLRWSAEDLARASALGVTTIRRAELTEGQTSMTTANDLAVRRVLEAAGVAFIDGNGDGPGVRLRSGQRKKGQSRP